MASASEVECEVIFINVREAIVVRTILYEMLNPQPYTPIQVDNSTCGSIINFKIQKTLQGDGHAFLLNEI